MHVSIVHRRVIGRDGKPMEHQQNWGTALAEGLRRHGVHVEIIEWGHAPRGDVIACWGWMIGQRFVAQRKPTLIIERGYIGDRKKWCSVGWDGLNGHARRPIWNDGGERWRRLFGHLERPWRDGGEFAVIMGQVEGDQAIAKVNIRAWYGQAAAVMRERGMMVVFRSHPESLNPAGPDVPTIHGSLAETLERAAVAVTYNSNAGVDAAIAGVPVIVCDRGSMAWPVAAHGLNGVILRPDRKMWCEQMAWAQWTKVEMSSGAAWDYLRHGI